MPCLICNRWVEGIDCQSTLHPPCDCKEPEQALAYERQRKEKLDCGNMKCHLWNVSYQQNCRVDDRVTKNPAPVFCSKYYPFSNSR